MARRNSWRQDVTTACSDSCDFMFCLSLFLSFSYCLSLSLSLFLLLLYTSNHPWPSFFLSSYFASFVYYILWLEVYCTCLRSILLLRLRWNDFSASRASSFQLDVSFSTSLVRSESTFCIVRIIRWGTSHTDAMWHVYWTLRWHLAIDSHARHFFLMCACRIRVILFVWWLKFDIILVERNFSSLKYKENV